MRHVGRFGQQEGGDRSLRWEAQDDHFRDGNRGGGGRHGDVARLVSGVRAKSYREGCHNVGETKQVGKMTYKI